jgi:hypothetical protein
VTSVCAARPSLSPTTGRPQHFRHELDGQVGARLGHPCSSRGAQVRGQVLHQLLHDAAGQQGASHIAPVACNRARVVAAPWPQPRGPNPVAPTPWPQPRGRTSSGGTQHQTGAVVLSHHRTNCITPSCRGGMPWWYAVVRRNVRRRTSAWLCSPSLLPSWGGCPSWPSPHRFSHACVLTHVRALPLWLGGRSLCLCRLCAAAPHHSHTRTSHIERVPSCPRVCISSLISRAAHPRDHAEVAHTEVARHAHGTRVLPRR